MSRPLMRNSQLRGSSAQTPVKKPKRPHAGRQPLPAHLSRIEHYHEPASCQCEECGRALVKIGEDISEQLDVQPAQFFVHRHIRPQYACRQCETITAAPIAAAIIDGGLPTVGLLTWVLIGKYQDHLPLYRLAQIAARDQVNLACSTLADWVGRTGVALQPLVDRLTTHLLAGNTLLADETPSLNSIPAKAKPINLIFGPIEVMIYKPGRASWSLIIRPVAVERMRGDFWDGGQGILWSMIMLAINPCSSLRARSLPVSNSRVLLMRGESFLIFIKSVKVPWL